MGQPTNEEIVRRYFAAHVNHDGDAMGELRHADWTVEWPQSGERIRGHDNERAMVANYPGGPPRVDAARLVGSEDRWVVTPAWTIQRIAGGGDFWWGDGVVDYPDGSTWHLAVLLELRDGKVYRETDYFAAKFEAPEWRAPWVERL